MQGHINKQAIINSFKEKTHLHKFDAITEVINEILPDDTAEMPYSDYYFMIYTIWNICENYEA